MNRPDPMAGHAAWRAAQVERDARIARRKDHLCAAVELRPCYRAGYDPDGITTEAINQLLDERRVRVRQVQVDCAWIEKGEDA